ncbi:hypothetical protein FocTR4_00002083, partial [Fusarium oxysporum f. sp. cubense]
MIHAVKHVTLELEPGQPSPGPQAELVLPRLIASSLSALYKLQGIQLDLWWFSDAQREELRNKCVALPVWTGLRSIQMEEADPELLALFVRALVKDVSSLRHLERLGLAFPRAILVAHQPGVPGTGTGMDAVEHYVRQLNSHIFAKLPALKQVAFLHGTTVFRAACVSLWGSVLSLLRPAGGTRDTDPTST